MSRVLLVVGATLPDGTRDDSSKPRKGYVALAEALDTTVLDRSRLNLSRCARLIAHVFGMPAAMAWLASHQRPRHAAILTDGEHIGIPLALLLKLAGAATPHVT